MLVRPPWNVILILGSSSETLWCILSLSHMCAIHLSVSDVGGSLSSSDVLKVFHLLLKIRPRPVQFKGGLILNFPEHFLLFHIIFVVHSGSLGFFMTFLWESQGFSYLFCLYSLWLPLLQGPNSGKTEQRVKTQKELALLSWVHSSSAQIRRFFYLRVLGFFMTPVSFLLLPLLQQDSPDVGTWKNGEEKKENGKWKIHPTFSEH